MSPFYSPSANISMWIFTGSVDLRNVPGPARTATKSSTPNISSTSLSRTQTVWTTSQKSSLSTDWSTIFYPLSWERGSRTMSGALRRSRSFMLMILMVLNSWQSIFTNWTLMTASTMNTSSGKARARWLTLNFSVEFVPCFMMSRKQGMRHQTTTKTSTNGGGGGASVLKTPGEFIQIKQITQLCDNYKFSLKNTIKYNKHQISNLYINYVSDLTLYISERGVFDHLLW